MMMLTAKDGKLSVRCADVTSLYVEQPDGKWCVIASMGGSNLVGRTVILAKCTDEAEAVEALRGYARCMESTIQSCLAAT